MSNKIYAVAAKRTLGSGDLFVDGVKEVSGGSIPASIVASPANLESAHILIFGGDNWYNATHMFMLIDIGGAKSDGYLEAITAAYDGSLLTIS